jgi:Asp-tRNA(Asn)/Glu-tRNA(Gln) amidotransferase A subunit family amidase
VLQSAPLSTTAAALRSGGLDLLAYIEQVCDRIKRIDVHIESFLSESDRFSRLKMEAKALEDRFPHPASRPLLYGVLVGVKDIFRVDGFATRAGSQLPPELFAGDEAACVRKLKAAGALVLGKTVTTVFAYFEPGPTRNPHNLKHTPGGSSSGSAAAVAAGLCPLALGTQTIGSIIRPAAFCGVVGFKPSYGRIDPTGVIFIAPSLDHVGLFTQDVEGMILAASVLCKDWQDAKAERLPVLGVPEGAYLQQTSAEGLQAFEEQLRLLERAGYTVRKVAALNNIAEIIQHHRALMAGEMAQIHREWFAEFESLYRPRTAEMNRMGQQVEAETLKKAHEIQMNLRAELEALMAETGIDLWVSPAALGPAPDGIESTGDPAMSFPWTFAGLPTVSLPAGYSASSLPLGMQCVGAFGSDEQLLAWAKNLADSLAPLARAPQ